jgi:hypothetical protein
VFVALAGWAVVIVAKPVDCQANPSWDGYYLHVTELGKYGCLEKVTH